MSDDNLAIVDGNHMPVYPAGLRWDMDLPHIGVTDLIDEAIAKYADHNCMEFMGTKITYREFGDMVDRAVTGLHDQGVGKGSRVGLFMPNTPYYPVMFYAALKLGATVVNYSISSTEKEDLRAKIKATDTTMMVTMDLKQFNDPVTDLLKEGELKQIVQCPMINMLPPIKRALFPLKMSGKTAPPPDGSDPRIIDFKTLTDNTGLFEPEAVDPDEIAVLQATNGTTGMSKFAMLSHFNLAASGLVAEAFFSAPSSIPGRAMLEPGKERSLAIIPFSHIFAMTTLMIASMHIGSELVMEANPKDTLAVLHAADANEITSVLIVPKLLQNINEHPKSLIPGLKKIWAETHGKERAMATIDALMHYPWFRNFDLSSLKSGVTGGEALPPGVRRDFKELTEGRDVLSEGIGMTEGCPTACNLGGEYNVPGTVGLPLPRTEIKVVDRNDHSRILKFGEEGHMMVRAPQVMQGYYSAIKGDAELIAQENAEAFEDGWLYTGDVVFMDENHVIHYVDRDKCMIKVNGLQVSPVAIEKVISLHPAVAECVVVGLPDPRSGEAAKALIRLKPGAAPVSERAMRDFLTENHITGIKMPKYVEFVTEQLPKLNGIKVHRFKIQAEERQKMLPPPDTSPAPAP